MTENIINKFKGLLPKLDFWSLRIVDEHRQQLRVRQDVAEPVQNRQSLGAHITVAIGQGIGYAATSDMSRSGLRMALRNAIDWANATAPVHRIQTEHLAKAKSSGRYQTNVTSDWGVMDLRDKLDLLKDINRQLEVDDAIVDRCATLEYRHSQVSLTTEDAEIAQTFALILPSMYAVANRGTETQCRTYGVEFGAQSGLEHLARIGFEGAAGRIAEEAVQLIQAPNCPSENCNLLLTPTQMLLQIHESIGHPLELDRILGDERNYAGTSFVTLDMFGNYRYGSDLLNVTYDPSDPQQIASYAFDDEGTAATRDYLIRDGILIKPLGGATSQLRGGIDGVANSRGCDWNRPPIDRMANLNVEPGKSSFSDLLGSIEHGILMDTNRSWSIDDKRNKFQFGCEVGRLIRNGEIGGLVKNPNYRGISATFWRNLKAVGDPSTHQVMGVTTCGKGEPNQAIHVGHASPACLFKTVDVFGGAA